MRFTRFFQGDTHFAVEVGFALRGLRFFNICRDTCSSAQNLAHHYAANAGALVQFATELDDANGKFKSAFNNVAWLANIVVRLRIRFFHF